MVSWGLRGVICSALDSGQAAGVSNILQRGRRAVSDFMSWPSVEAHGREYYTARQYVESECPPAGCHTGRSAQRLTESWGDAVPSSLSAQIGSFPKLWTVHVLPKKGNLESVGLHQEAELLAQRANKPFGKDAPQRKSQNRQQAESQSWKAPPKKAWWRWSTART